MEKRSTARCGVTRRAERREQLRRRCQNGSERRQEKPAEGMGLLRRPTQRHSAPLLPVHSLLQGRAATCARCGEGAAARKEHGTEQHCESNERVARPAEAGNASRRALYPWCEEGWCGACGSMAGLCACSLLLQVQWPAQWRPNRAESRKSKAPHGAGRAAPAAQQEGSRAQHWVAQLLCYTVCRRQRLAHLARCAIGVCQRASLCGVHGSCAE